VEQWREEMARFFATAPAPAPGAPDDPLVIASIDGAKRPGRREALRRRTWDLVIVDEAHRLKNRHTQNHELVRELAPRRLLLLTATPIENDLDELYSLVSLVRPGLFGSYLDFYRQFVLDRRRPKNRARLREVLGRVMVRRTREEAGLRLPPRHVELLPLELSPPERRLYDRLTELLRQEYHRRRRARETILPLVLLQRELTSSTYALADTLGRMGTVWFGEHLGEVRSLLAAVADNAKGEAVRSFLARIDEPAVVFTEYRATQDYLMGKLASVGRPVQAYHGGLPPQERARRLRRFEREGGVLVATEAGSQGLNLQFCRLVVNYDLPWNPMRVEQRIGRVHRLGQTRPVEILNLYAEDTVEAHILRLLHEKLDLFRQVIGEIDVVIRNIEREEPLESQLLHILLSSPDPDEVTARLDELARRLRRTSGEGEGHPAPAALVY
jgi:SNF2 family DNA or RNA helicase